MDRQVYERIIAWMETQPRNHRTLGLACAALDLPTEGLIGLFRRQKKAAEDREMAKFR